MRSHAERGSDKKFIAVYVRQRTEQIGEVRQDVLECSFFLLP